jgi:hypothetical protein
MLGVGVAHGGGAISHMMARFHGGGLSADEVPIIAQEGEFMIRREVAQMPGMAEYLLGLNEGRGRRGSYYQSSGPYRPRAAHSRQEAVGPHMINPVTGEPWQGGDDPFAGISDVGHTFYNPYNFFYNMPPGQPWSPTLIPTTYDPQGYPMAVPVYIPNVTDIANLEHAGQHIANRHSGGFITRMHGGGSVSGGGGGIHIYAFTDLKALTKHLGSREGKKIIFDTVKGRSIDLGIK